VAGRSVMLPALLRRKPSRRAVVAGVVVLMALSAGVSWQLFHGTSIDLDVMTATARRPLVVQNGKVEQMPAGDYLAANTLVDTTGCSSTNVIAWNGTQFACAAAGGGGGLSGGSGSNVVMWTGTSTVGYPGVNDQLQIGGPMIQNLTLGSAYAFGEVNVVNLGGNGPVWPADTFAYVVHNNVSYDVTSHDQRSGGGAFETTSPKVGTGHVLTNIGFECLAQNGDTNLCLEALSGDVQVDTGNIYTNGASAYIFENGTSGFIAAAGIIYAEGNGAEGIDITGSPTYSINSTNAASTWNVHNASASTLTFSDDAGQFTHVIDGNFKLAAQAVGTGSVHLISTGPAVSLTTATCSSTNCTDIAGTVTSSSTSMTITFASTYTGANDATCIILPQGTATMPVCTESATAITCTTVVNATKYNYQCIGHQ
ncbi:MAG TPA: hypothetical protein VIV58_23045, partial [Kofleriaceae bacterium]